MKGLIAILNKILFIISVISISLNLAFAEDHIIKMVFENKQFSFEPKEIKIKINDTITWVNETSMYHNIKTTPSDIPKEAKPFISSGMSKVGDKWSQAFVVKGTYNYFCAPHKGLGMVGKIIVE